LALRLLSDSSGKGGNRGEIGEGLKEERKGGIARSGLKLKDLDAKKDRSGEAL
jgi:hypothetical protein